MDKKRRLALEPEQVPERPWAVAGGIWAAVLGAQLAWSDRFVAEYTLPKLALLSAGLSVCAAGIVASLRRGALVVRKTPLDGPLLALGLALAVSTWASRDRLLSLLGGYDSHDHGVWAFGLYAAVYWVCAWCLDGPRRRTTLHLAAAVAGLAACYGLFQAAGAEPFSRTRELPNGRAISTLGSPVYLGALLVIPIPLCLHWALFEKGERLRGALCLLLLGGGIFAAVSRGGMLAALAGMGVYLALSGRARLPAMGRAGWAAAALAAAIGLGLLARGFSRGGAVLSDAARIEAWRTGLAIARRFPILGTGPDTFGQAFRGLKEERFISLRGTSNFHGHAHNDLIQAAATTGAAGTAAYLYLLACVAGAFASAWRDPARREEYSALFGGLFALFVYMKFNPVPVSVLAMGALWAGLLCPAAAPEAGAQPRRPGTSAWAFAISLLLACVASTAGVLRLCAADASVKKARAANDYGDKLRALRHVRRGLELNPCETNYRIYHANLIADLARQNQAPNLQSLLQEARETGRAAVACHPRELNAHVVDGFAALIAAQHGRAERLADAEAALDEAIRLDPTDLSTLSLRLEAARLRGDAKTTNSLTRRMADLQRRAGG